MWTIAAFKHDPTSSPHKFCRLGAPVLEGSARSYPENHSVRRSNATQFELRFFLSTTERLW